MKRCRTYEVKWRANACLLIKIPAMMCVIKINGGIPNSLNTNARPDQAQIYGRISFHQFCPDQEIECAYDQVRVGSKFECITENNKKLRITFVSPTVNRTKCRKISTLIRLRDNNTRDDDSDKGRDKI